MLAASIRDLEARGHAADGLRRELGRLAGFAAMLLFEDRATWSLHARDGIQGWRAMRAAARTGTPVAYSLQ